MPANVRINPTESATALARPERRKSIVNTFSSLQDSPPKHRSSNR
jgi:hypothetical protein